MSLKVIIPMTGYGTRFKNAGYKKFKPFIRVHGTTIIEHIFSMYSKDTEFILLMRSETLMEYCSYIKFLTTNYNCEVLIIASEKKGPVYDILLSNLGNLFKNDPIIVNYCDFFCLWDFDKFINNTKDYDGSIPVYTGFHPHLVHFKNVYASCKTDDDMNLLEIREKYSFEKDKTKAFHSPGIYYFKTGKIMNDCFNQLVNANDSLNGEFYVSLAYNYMIKSGLKVLVDPCVDYFCQWGTPEDLKEFEYWIEIFDWIEVFEEEVNK